MLLWVWESANVCMAIECVPAYNLFCSSFIKKLIQLLQMPVPGLLLNSPALPALYITAAYGVLY